MHRKKIKENSGDHNPKVFKEHSPQPNEATYYLEIRDAEFEKKMKNREFRQWLCF
jgi:hypothetical protein